MLMEGYGRAPLGQLENRNKPVNHFGTPNRRRKCLFGWGDVSVQYALLINRGFEGFCKDPFGFFQRLRGSRCGELTMSLSAEVKSKIVERVRPNRGRHRFT